ncbi:unnamed protein product [Phaedon cochleariae]|uniref:Delta-sarcoglycan n=1 Tax=Phaedon cochleariae TaxID=80249 RepID=A0A9N9SIL9_PHACE|nr:unnamed protein product [Phaedon cochleariae]
MKKSEAAACDTPGSRSQIQEDSDTLDPKYNFRIGIYGWRKKCLYILIFVLLVMVVVNLALTLWVLKVMEFSSEGMGQLKIVSGGLKLEGKAFILDSLIASSIRSRVNQPIVIESTRNLTMRARDGNGYANSWMVIGNDRMESLAKTFKILDEKGSVIFSANRSEVTVGSDSLRVTGEGGTKFTGSVQATRVRAPAGHELRLESPTRTLQVRAPRGIHMESLGGKLDATILLDMTFRSEVGAIRLDAGSILMPLLPTAKVVSRPATGSKHDIFQLCVCESGKLFLASPHLVCASENDDRLCR